MYISQYVQSEGQNVQQQCHKSSVLLVLWDQISVTASTPLPPPSLYSSISSIRSSPSREESGATWTAFTVPLSGELTTVSIFMAERTHSGWPFSTWE